MLKFLNINGEDWENNFFEHSSARNDENELTNIFDKFSENSIAKICFYPSNVRDRCKTDEPGRQDSGEDPGDTHRASVTKKIQIRCNRSTHLSPEPRALFSSAKREKSRGNSSIAAVRYFDDDSSITEKLRTLEMKRDLNRLENRRAIARLIYYD